jgi:type II secretory pathway predicted ATPase ExeA
MYLQFYELKKHPFRTNPDPGFLWFSGTHIEALATLEYGILRRNGFILLSGDIGTGKTTLVRHLLSKVIKDSLVAFIFDPDMPPLGFFNFLSEELGLNKRFDDKSDFLIHFKNFLYTANNDGKSVFIIIDEAQRLTQETLEQLRLLSNIETDDQKLLNIFFVGQSELREILMKKGNEAISQRITMSYHLLPLSEPETLNYIAHRLKVAGAKRGIFTVQACKAIYSITEGIPRLINSVCDCALLSGYAADRKVVDQKLIHECQMDLRIPIGTIDKDKRAMHRREIETF